MSVALAQAPGVHLEWERPVGSLCPSRQSLETDVEQLMDRPIFTSADKAHLVVRGVIEDGATEARVQLEARTKDGALLGTRELIAPAARCASLRGAITLVLTLFVERADAVRGGSEDTSNTRFGIGAAASVSSTPLPRATFAVGPSISLEVGRFLRFHGNASYWLPVSIETRRGVGAKLEALSFALRVCARLWGDERTFAFRLCAGADMGGLIASPLKLDGPKRQTRLLALGILDLRWETSLGSFALLDLAAGPVLSLSRPNFSYVRSDGTPMQVYRPQLGGIYFQLAFIILGS